MHACKCVSGPSHGQGYGSILVKVVNSVMNASFNVLLWWILIISVYVECSVHGLSPDIVSFVASVYFRLTYYFKNHEKKKNSKV